MVYVANAVDFDESDKHFLFTKTKSNVYDNMSFRKVNELITLTLHYAIFAGKDLMKKV